MNLILDSINVGKFCFQILNPKLLQKSGVNVNFLTKVIKHMVALRSQMYCNRRKHQQIEKQSRRHTKHNRS